MMQLQEAMNRLVHPAWRQQGYEWYRAVWMECAELVGHSGYQWWRDEPVNQVQRQLEVVDIWHFGLSALMEKQSTAELAPWLARQFADLPPLVAADVVECAESLAADSLRRRDFDMALFLVLLGAAELSPTALYQHYVGKNMLNRFRQDHGYRDGSYRKLWGGLEDNEHLAQILASLSAREATAEPADFSASVYTELQRCYEASAGKSKG